MKQTHYLTTKVLTGNRIDICLSNLPVGETIEVILIVPEAASKAASNMSIKRQAFRQLPIEERHRILTEQAETMKEYYQEDKDWKDWISFDNREIYED
ncbi:MAG: hypothetical protein F6K40_04185 [Okeania sp. SIO3I5]|uniref:hypothetical protein n=1 Tax=Okeania sp. SIO3I5 TaxID=2607805 RepID=UPI0013BB35D6|nr:hypothetical protein [Okeania sp. SIO3I5]NEQ35540.1 hypothetical protein [Okeania sp. SIO3I5]